MIRDKSSFFILLLLLSVPSLLSADIYMHQEAKLKPPGGEPSQQFGKSVDISGNLAIVGAPTTRWDGIGKAYIYRHTGESWILEATLSSDFPNQYDLFGFSVSISGDLAVVGNPMDEENYPGGWIEHGAVHVYRRSPVGTWSQEAKLFGDADSGPWHFGWSVDTDGQRIIAGEQDEICNSTHSAVCLFEFTEGSWPMITYFSHGWMHVYYSCGTYGNSVAIDGPWSVVGNSLWDHDIYYSNLVGAVELYDDQSLSERIFGWEGLDEYGYAVDVDGGLFVAGAPGENQGGVDRGAVRIGSGIWITPDDSHDDQQFGLSVSLKDNLLAVASGEKTVYLFEYDPIPQSWAQAASFPDTGTQVAMDNERMIIGNLEASDSTGEVRIFSQCQSSVDTMIACEPSSGTLPFLTNFDIVVTNCNPFYHRRISNRVDVTIGNGQFYSNWRRGWDNYAPGTQKLRSWFQLVPELPTLIGDNTFSLFAEDVTPAPYNQPPYPAAGDTATDSCVLTAIE